MDGVLVEDVSLGTARLHHHAPTDRVEGIRDDTRDRGDSLRDGPADDEWCVLGVGQHATGGVIEAEVRRTVDDDTLHGHSEASVETTETVRLEDLADAVEQALVFTGVSLADVGGEAGTGEVERVHEAQGGRAGGTTGRQVTREVAPELRVLVYASEEHLLVLVLEGEVQRLGGEVPDHVGHVSTPEGQETLLLGNADEGIDDTLVALVSRNLLADVLYLQQQLHALDGRDGGLGDCGGDTASDEIFRERDRISEVRHFVLGGCSLGNYLAGRGGIYTHGME